MSLKWNFLLLKHIRTTIRSKLYSIFKSYKIGGFNFIFLNRWFCQKIGRRGMFKIILFPRYATLIFWYIIWFIFKSKIMKLTIVILKKICKQRVFLLFIQLISTWYTNNYFSVRYFFFRFQHEHLEKFNSNDPLHSTFWNIFYFHQINCKKIVFYKKMCKKNCKNRVRLLCEISY